MANNIITISGVYNKTPGMIYRISPCPDERGMMPKCTRKVNADGDLILSEADKTFLSQGGVLLPEDQPIVVHHGSTFNLDDPLQAAQWECIKHSRLIVSNPTNERGEQIEAIAGTKSMEDSNHNARGRWGLAELYIDRPGEAAKIRTDKRRLVHQAEGLVLDDSLEHRVLICKLFEKDMSHAHSSDVEEYLLTQAQKYPEKLIKFYNAEESSIRLLIITAKEKGIITTQSDGMYYADIKLGSTLELVVEKLRNDKVMKEEIKKESFPNLETKVGVKEESSELEVKTTAAKKK